ncbi:hypothetical protein [Halomontanus rarus]|uniref:hypothetical protein n=1 Tax=Halomontanus rarus TaxID=3034020 RepID=UPI00307BC6B6
MTKNESHKGPTRRTVLKITSRSAVGAGALGVLAGGAAASQHTFTAHGVTVTLVDCTDENGSVLGSFEVSGEVSRGTLVSINGQPQVTLNPSSPESQTFTVVGSGSTFDVEIRQGRQAESGEVTCEEDCTVTITFISDPPPENAECLYRFENECDETATISFEVVSEQEFPNFEAPDDIVLEGGATADVRLVHYYRWEATIDGEIVNSGVDGCEFPEP